MKVFVYLMVFCMLLFLLILSFDEGRQSGQISEFDQAGATVMSEIDGTWTAQTENAMQMQASSQIQTAQQEQTTVWDMAVSDFKQMIHQWSASIWHLFEKLKEHTKISAYTFVGDMAELIYPTKKSVRLSAVLEKQQDNASMQEMENQSRQEMNPISLIADKEAIK